MDGEFLAVSVVVPCRNEKDYIERCVRSILAQESPTEGFEIIVADGMSEDGTRDILNRLTREDTRLRIVENLHKLTPCGVNAGIREARGRYIAIMGAHNSYAPDYLRQSVQVLEEKAVDNVGGSMICEGDSYLQKAIALAHHCPFAVGGARWHDPHFEGPTDTVFGGVYRREVFDRVGLFDEEFLRNQDDEFNLRLIRAGGKIWQSRRIKSWYQPRRNLNELFRQYYQYGYWKVRVIQKHKAIASIRHLVPGCFLVVLLALPLASLWWPPAAWLWVALVGTYLTSTVSASVVTAAGHGRKFFLVLPVVVACYHFAYGLGFLRGIWDFVILRRGPALSCSELTRSAANS